MALREVEGKPGWFFDEQSGRLVEIGEMTEDPGGTLLEFRLTVPYRVLSDAETAAQLALWKRD